MTHAFAFLMVFISCALALTVDTSREVEIFVNPCNGNSNDNPRNNGTNPGEPLRTISTALGAAQAFSSTSACSTIASVVILLQPGCIYPQSRTLDVDTTLTCVNEDGSRHSLSLFIGLRTTSSSAPMATISGAKAFVLRNTSLSTIVESPTDIWDLWTASQSLEGGFDRVSLATSPLMHYQQLNHSYVPNATCFVDENLIGLNISLQNELRHAFVRLYQSWTSSHNRIHSFDSLTGRLCVEGVYHGHFLHASGNRYYIQNANYAPWNSATGAHVSFFFEPSTKGNFKITVSSAVRVVFVPQVATVLSFKNTSNVHITSGIRVAHSLSMLSESCLGGCGQSASSLPTAALEVSDATQVSITGVRVEHTGSYGAWIHGSAHYVNFTKSTLTDLGCGGVRIGEPRGGVDHNIAAVSSNILLADTKIHDGGHTVEAGCGVLLQQARQSTVTHNKIFDMFYTGISTGWDWGYTATSNADLNISFNWIYNIGRNRLSDMGCIYNLGISPGTVFDNNLCHDVYSFGYGGWGLYSDQATSDVVWQNNIVFRTKGAGYHHHFGLNVSFVNNVVAHPFALNATSYGADSSGIRSSQDSRSQLSSFVAHRNIVLLNHPSSIPLFGTQVNSFNNVTLFNNVYWSTSLSIPVEQLTFPPRQKPVNFDTWQNIDHKDKSSVVEDPLFCPNNGGRTHEFTCLEPNSPAIQLGFVPINMNDVGVRS